MLFGRLITRDMKPGGLKSEVEGMDGMPGRLAGSGQRLGFRCASLHSVRGLLKYVMQCTLYSCSWYTGCIYRGFTPLLLQIK